MKCALLFVQAVKAFKVFLHQYCASTKIRQTLAAEYINGLNADSPPIRRGSTLALGAMPKPLLAPCAHGILSNLAAATKVLLP